jgi:hypothetical protein
VLNVLLAILVSGDEKFAIDALSRRPHVTTKQVVLVPRRIETTLIARTITSESPQVFGDDTINGNGGEDILIGGVGNDAIGSSADRDLIFANSVALDRSSHLGDYSNLRFQTLQVTQIYSTAPATAGEDQASNVPQADPRGHGAWGDCQITLLDHSDQPPTIGNGNFIDLTNSGSLTAINGRGITTFARDVAAGANACFSFDSGVAWEPCSAYRV